MTIETEQKDKEQKRKPQRRSYKRGEENKTENKKARSNNKKESIKFEFKKENLKIIPLGGLEEIGKNITVFEYGNEIVLVDCGLEFPEDNMLGVDLVIPDVTYLERNNKRFSNNTWTRGSYWSYTIYIATN